MNGWPSSQGSHDKNHDGDIGRQELVPAKKRKQKGKRKKVCIYGKPLALKSTDVLYGCPPSHGSHDEIHDGDIGRQELVSAKKKKEASLHCKH